MCLPQLRSFPPIGGTNDAPQSTSHSALEVDELIVPQVGAYDNNRQLASHFSQPLNMLR